jgi:thiamine pyrophosphate-dependent acetolactate synthase large subunit-like protein
MRGRRIERMCEREKQRESEKVKGKKWRQREEEQRERKERKREKERKSRRERGKSCRVQQWGNNAKHTQKNGIFTREIGETKKKEHKKLINNN